MAPSPPDALNKGGTEDATGTPTGEGQASVVTAADHRTQECSGIRAALLGARFAALERIPQGIREYLGSCTERVAHGLALRHDSGSQCTSRYFQGELGVLGIESIPGHLREPEGNGVAERFIRTLTELLLWMERFEVVEELRRALPSSRCPCNQRWLVSSKPGPPPSLVLFTGSG